ncbi:hypothetical protein BSQ44_25875 (plasmid) [Aquibium oceanicum]|uniref:DUF1403 family protein n=2 Tax=Aquibium oceanicum TaxID=1670800 RepID=A0A1L3SZX3_9HYPH|nr:hypothetical protein BSQ44_25875 [Aquibium oceanicum]
MILRPQPTSRQHTTLGGAASTAPMAPVPAWLRRAVPDAQSLAGKGVEPNALEDVALAAGAAIGALDAVVRRQERWSGAWRQRLALAAAAVTTKQAGRAEDEGQLRDAILLTRPGDDVGPAGRMFSGWRRLAGTPAEKLLTVASIGTVLDDFGIAHDDAAIGDLAHELRQNFSAGVVGLLTGAFAAAERHGFGRVAGAWFADALVAQRLGWAHAVPLLGREASLGARTSLRRSAASAVVTSIETDAERVITLLAAQARAPLRAIDLFAELGRRADRLLGVAPKLRARAADAVVERLLSDDAMVASQQIAGMSDRGLRRLFDRLVELGAVRELSGRSTFRIYGL